MTATSSSSASWLETMCFVTWSATTAATVTRASESHCAASADSDRSATETAASPSRLGFLAGGASAAGASELTLAALLLRRQSMHCVAYGIASRRSSPIGRAARRADAVRAGIDALESCVDRAEHVVRCLLERVVDLAIERDRRGLADVVADRRLLGLLSQRPRVLLVEVVERGDDALSLVEQPAAVGLGRPSPSALHAARGLDGRVGRAARRPCRAPCGPRRSRAPLLARPAASRARPGARRSHGPARAPRRREPSTPRRSGRRSRSARRRARRATSDVCWQPPFAASIGIDPRRRYAASSSTSTTGGSPSRSSLGHLVRGVESGVEQQANAACVEHERLPLCTRSARDVAGLGARFLDDRSASNGPAP